jgi:hypothetical protein
MPTFAAHSVHCYAQKYEIQETDITIVSIVFVVAGSLIRTQDGRLLAPCVQQQQD